MAPRCEVPGRRRSSPDGNGGRHCCQPPLRRAKDLPVFASLGPAPVKDWRPTSRSWLTSSGVASPSNNSLPKKEPRALLECAARRLASLSSVRPTQRSKPSEVRRPFLGSSFLCPALPLRPKASKPRRTGEDHLFRRLSRLALARLPKKSPLRLPAEIGPLVTCRPEGGWDRCPDHPFRMTPRSESRQAKNPGASLWITGISGATVGTLSQLPSKRRFGCRSVLLALPRSGARIPRADP